VETAMLIVVALEDGPATNDAEAPDADKAEGFSEPYPPALAAAASTVLSPDESASCAWRAVASSTPGALVTEVVDEPLDLNMVLSRITVRMAVAPKLSAVTTIEYPRSLPP
jgi:hypothetical protein